jgi:predicted ATP-dependent endonuclease of OLD family
VTARLKSLQVEGLRCLDGLTLSLDALTAIIGANGSGKSSTVRAMLFLFGQVELDVSDVTDGLAEPEIAVTGTFTSLTPAWAAHLARWLDADGDLVLTRTWAQRADGRAASQWTVPRRQVPGFAEVRTLAASGAAATDVKAAYVALRAQTAELPTWSSKAQGLAALDAFEESNPDLVTVCVADSTLHFGGGGEFDLQAMCELLVLPAMRDATDDAAETRGSTLARLVDLTVRATEDMTVDLDELTAKTTRTFEGIVTARLAPRLEELSEIITAQMSSFAPGSRVVLSCEPRPPVLAKPTVRARIVESGHAGDIGQQGHGVQRAYVFALLRALLEAYRAEGDRSGGVVLVVEEPEAYQHPVRARFVARTLADLAASASHGTQVIYTTHSPYFVAVDDVPSVRLLRLAAAATGDAGGAQRTRASWASLGRIADSLEAVREGGQKWTAERVGAQLPGLLASNVAEGLFADCVIVVEGDEDAGIVDGAAVAAGVDLAGDGIAVVAAGGKDSVLLAAAVFRELQVPTYVIFDTDEKAAGQVSDAGALRLNAMLTLLIDGTADAKPVTGARPLWAAVKPTLRGVLEEEMGAETVRATYAETAKSMGLSEASAKNGYLARTAVTSLYAAGHSSRTLNAIVAAAVARRTVQPVG